MSFVPRSINRIIVHHSGVSDSVGPSQIATAHLERGFDDIGYHHLIDPDGLIVMGRPEAIAGAHTFGANDDSIGVCLLGDFSINEPSDHQLRALSLLVDRCRRRYNIPPEAIYGHCEVPQRDGSTRTTHCPGQKLLRAVHTLQRRGTEVFSSDRPYGKPWLSFDIVDPAAVRLMVVIDRPDAPTWLKTRTLEDLRETRLVVSRVSDGSELTQAHPSNVDGSGDQISVTWKIPPEALFGSVFIAAWVGGPRASVEEIVFLHEFDGPLSGATNEMIDPFRCSVRTGLCMARDETVRVWVQLRRLGSISWLRGDRGRPKRLRVRAFRGMGSNILVKEWSSELPSELGPRQDEFVEFRLGRDELPGGAVTFVTDIEIRDAMGSDKLGASCDRVGHTIPDRAFWLSSIPGLDRLEM